MRDFLLLFAFVALVGSIYYNQQMSKKLQDSDRVLSQEEKRLSKLEKSLDGERARDEEELRNDEAYLRKYQADYQGLQNNRDNISARLVQAKNLNTGGRQIDSAQWDIGLEKKTVGDIEAQIKILEQQKKDYKYNVDQYNQNEKLDHDRNLASANEQIGFQEIKIKQMNDQYNDLKAQKNDVTAQYNAKQLKSQIEEQRVVLQKMKASRDAINLNWQAQKNDSASKSAANINDINAKEDFLKAQLNHEKNTYGQIDQRLKDSKKSETEQKAEISKLEQDLRNTDASMGDLRQKIQDAEARIKELKAKLVKNPAA